MGGLLQPLPVDLTGQDQLLSPSVGVLRYTGDGILRETWSESGRDLFFSATLLAGYIPDLLKLRERYQYIILHERLAAIRDAKQKLAAMYGLSEGTLITADGEGKNTYDLVTAGLLPEQPMCPITGKALLVNPIGTAPTSPLFGEATEEAEAKMEEARKSLQSEGVVGWVRDRWDDMIQSGETPGS